MKRLYLCLVLALGVTILSAVPAIWAQEAPQQAASLPTHTVEKGDTPSAIAKMYYGKPNLGSALFSANKGNLANPRQLTPGDVLIIYPEQNLKAVVSARASKLPPKPEGAPKELYDRGSVLKMVFPKYFTYLADDRGLAGEGSTRIKVRKYDVHSKQEVSEYFEVRDLGEIIASSDRGAAIDIAGKSTTAVGKTLLSTGDNVMLRMTEDLAKIIDSDTYDDADPYFREFPIYSYGETILAPDKKRSDYGQNLGRMMTYKGKVTIVSRVETAVPVPNKQRKSSPFSSKSTARGQDNEPVIYVAKITYAQDAIRVGDRVFIFVPLDPGPERMLDSPSVEPKGSFNSSGY